MLLDGLKVANERNEKLKLQIEKDLSLGIKAPSSAIILVGNDPASQIYVRSKVKAAKKVGINSQLIELDENIKEEELELIINKLNNDNNVDGILLQLPLPKHLNENKFINLINSNKDIDGFTLINQGKLFQREKTINAATPQGIMNLLNHYEINVSGLNAVVIGRSQIVGLPMAKLLLDANATVTVCHSRTKDLKQYTKNADLIVVAVGSPKMLTSDMVKEGVIIIDVGINRLNNKLVGDVDFDNVYNKASYITPVPKGVGPMTINALLENIYKVSKINR